MARSRIDCSPKEYPIQLRQAIAAYLPARGLALIDARRWSDRLLAMVMLLLVWSGGSALIDRFHEARSCAVRMYASRKRPGRSLAGFMQTLAHHSQRLVALIAGTLRQRMRQDLCAHWRIGGFAAFGFDGSKIDTPRTRANERKFKRGGRAKSGPQMVLGLLIHLGTGLVWSWRRSDACVPERTQLRELLEDLPEKSLLVTDAGLTGYELLATILAAGHSILMRVGANVTLLKKLGYAVREHEGVVYLWTQRAQKQGLEPLILRQIVLTDGRNRRMCLLTNLLSSRELSPAQARALYARRWGMELVFRAMKQTLGRRKMLCDSPAHAEMELDWCVLGLWMLGLMLFEKRREKTPACDGFAACLRVVRNAIANRGRARANNLPRQLAGIRRDAYRRRRPKTARHWPHKKNDPPCGLPEMRMATRTEIALAKGISTLKQAA